MHYPGQGKQALPHGCNVLDMDAQQQQSHAHNGDHTPSCLEYHLLSQQKRALSSSTSSLIQGITLSCMSLTLVQDL